MLGRNIPDKLPDRLQEQAKEPLHATMYADDRQEADGVREAFRTEFASRYEKAAACLDEDREELLTFLPVPGEHRTHPRTTNVIEGIFSPVKVRTRKTKGSGSRQAGH